MLRLSWHAGQMQDNFCPGGCVTHMAPELVVQNAEGKCEAHPRPGAHNMADHQAADVWAAGCVAHNILMGAPLFDIDQDDEEYLQIAAVEAQQNLLVRYYSHALFLFLD